MHGKRHALAGDAIAKIAVARFRCHAANPTVAAADADRAPDRDRARSTVARCAVIAVGRGLRDGAFRRLDGPIDAATNCEFDPRARGLQDTGKAVQSTRLHPERAPLAGAHTFVVWQTLCNPGHRTSAVETPRRRLWRSAARTGEGGGLVSNRPSMAAAGTSVQGRRPLQFCGEAVAAAQPSLFVAGPQNRFLRRR